jgi:hypothetical protein
MPPRRNGNAVWDRKANVPVAARPSLSTRRGSSYKMAVLEFLTS